jgi:hypothetical protein
VPAGANTTIKLYNVEGRIVFESHQLTSITVIDVSTLAKGLYMLEHIVEGHSVMQRVVLE